MLVNIMAIYRTSHGLLNECGAFACDEAIAGAKGEDEAKSGAPHPASGERIDGGPYPVAVAAHHARFSNSTDPRGVFHRLSGAGAFAELANLLGKMPFVHRGVSGVAPFVVHGGSKCCCC